MAGLLRELDDLLRGNKTQPEQLAEGTKQLRLVPFITLSVLLAAVYGVCMGLYSVLSRDTPVPAQLLASTVKVPMLFLLTLVVTFPSLYVFSALLGSRLRPPGALRVIVAAITVNVAILASFGPITAFFTFTTTSYHFMKLLSFFFFALSGVIGLAFLMGVLRRMEEGLKPPAPAPAAAEDEDEEPGLLPQGVPSVRRDDNSPARPMARQVFRVWLILYGLVGAQMGWVLRPFIGTPHLPFTWFRQRGDNVFLDVVRTIGELLGG